MNALRMALDSIREKKGRSFLTMLGIIIGVTAVLVLVALVSGYNADITAYYEKLGVNKVNVTVNWYDTSRSVDVIDALYDYGNGELGDMVLGVSPDLSTSLPMKYRTTTLDSGTLYLGSDQFSVCGNYTLKEGRDISAFDVDRRSRVCVLGSYVADSLFQYADPIGETVYFGGEPFTVVGIYYQKDGGEEGSMDDMAVIPYSLDRAILGTAQLTHFSVKVDQSDHMDTVMAKLERFLGETIDTSVGEYELENGNSAMSESTEEMTSMSVVLGGIAGIALLALTRMRWVLPFQLFNMVIEVMSGTLRGLGYSFVPTILCAVFVCGLRILWVAFVFPLMPTFQGLLLVYPASWLAAGAAVTVAYWALKRKLLTEKPPQAPVVP